MDTWLFRVKLKTDQTWIFQVSKLKNLELFQVFSSFTWNNHVFRSIRTKFLQNLNSKKLEIFEFETQKSSKYSSLKIQFQVKSSLSFGFKLKKAQIKKTQNILSIFEFQDFESSYAIAYCISISLTLTAKTLTHTGIEPGTAQLWASLP